MDSFGYQFRTSVRLFGALRRDMRRREFVIIAEVLLISIPAQMLSEQFKIAEGHRAQTDEDAQGEEPGRDKARDLHVFRG